MTITEQVADALRQHRAVPTGSPFCACGWRPGLMLNDTESDRQQHLYHQAEALAAAGLIPTETEWGVRTGPHVVDDFDEDRARRFAQVQNSLGIDKWTVIQRGKTGWRDA
jgi:hypothetical protein